MSGQCITFPANTLPELIAYCQSQPGKLNVRFGWQLHRATTRRRILQVDDRKRPHPRALSCYDRYLPDLLSGQVQRQFRGRCPNRINTSAKEEAARPCGYESTPGGASGYPGLGRIRAGLRYEAAGWGLVRPRTHQLRSSKSSILRSARAIADPKMKEKSCRRRCRPASS